MTTILIYALVTTTLYYLGARALITEWLWSRYPPWLNRLTLCAACSGFWYGILVGAFGYWRNLPYGPMPGARIDTVITVGICSATWTPILAALAIRALAELGSEGGDDDAALQKPQGDLLDDPGQGRAGDDRGRLA